MAFIVACIVSAVIIGVIVWGFWFAFRNGGPIDTNY